ncbi:MAG TPA: hypothetical protein VM095_07290 [Pyrinomonadaceae bacterium]|nr:hypothetical protein [Pyrinomonadaceae bacterium]
MLPSAASVGGLMEAIGAPIELRGALPTIISADALPPPLALEKTDGLLRLDTVTVVRRRALRRRRLFLRLLPVVLLLLFRERAVGGLIVGGLIRDPESLGASCACAVSSWTNPPTHKMSAAREMIADLRMVFSR